MRYGSICSGIESASVAWSPLGWMPTFFAENDKFPSAVLKHHYPDIPNHGDITRFEEWPDAAIDLLVGGTPCQSFSIAGLRKGLDDLRGNLMFDYAAIARRYRPRWLVWENVPGVFSSDGGRDFASLLGLLSGCRITVPADGWRNAGIVEGYQGAYGLAWRVLDAQYVRIYGYGRAVPQRRRRVFIVGYSGDWRRAASVLLERQGLSGNNPPRRQAGQKPAPTISSRTTGGGGLGTDFDLDGGLIPVVAARMVAFGEYEVDGTASALKARDFKDATDLIAFDSKRTVQRVERNVAPTLRAMPHNTSHANAGGQIAVADVALNWAVRRLMPIECERLQGFPDNYTLIPWRGRPAPDGPRYRALGNAMACNVMRWIAHRIEMVEALTSEEAA